MKRLGHVFDSLCDRENLVRAFHGVERGRWHRADLRRYRERLDGHLNDLARRLLAGGYSFGPYHSFQIHDPKERTIHVAPVEDRIVHHALIQVAGERLESGLIPESYACRRGLGQYAALACGERLGRRHPWCLKLDMRHYFDSIDHGVLARQLSRKIKDRRALALLEALIGSYETLPGKGLPIGNLTSQYFANLYLDEFDRWAGAVAGRGYVRYMDDVLVFGGRDDLKRLRREAEGFLDSRLGLTLKHGGSLHRCAEGVDFLGYRIFPDRLLLSRRSRLRFARKLREYGRRFRAGELSETSYQDRLTALFAFVRHADSYHLRRRELGRVAGL